MISKKTDSSKMMRVGIDLQVKKKIFNKKSIKLKCLKTTDEE